MISKQLFIETIEAIKKQIEHDRKCAEAFDVILPNDYTTTYDNSHIFKAAIKLLQTIFNDDLKPHSWIEYFIWELDFGKKYKPGCTKKNGENIDLSTPGKLYDFLIENLKEKE